LPASPFLFKLLTEALFLASEAFIQLPLLLLATKILPVLPLPLGDEGSIKVRPACRDDDLAGRDYLGG
jgi:hypothetical protein